LLVTIAIIAVIGAFTIPKVLSSQNEKGYNASAKTFASELQAAYIDYQMENQPTASTKLWSLSPYLNYVKVDTATIIDHPNGSNTGCGDSGRSCLLLNSGARVRFSPNYTFGGTNTTSGTYVYFDPDGKDSSVYGVQFVLYYNGDLKSGGTKLDNTCDNMTCPISNYSDPPWFDWSK